MSSFVPIGYHFAPLDYELIIYLVHHITGRGDDVIIHANVFDAEPPWELFKRCCSNVGFDKNAYFFSVVTKKGKIGLTNFNRAVGKIGTWKGNNRGTDITDPKNKRVVLGTKRKFSFKIENNYDQSCKWLMTEYSLAGEYKEKYACGSDHQEYVICKIKKKIDNTKRREQVGCSASSAIRQNDLEQFLPREINLESAQAQSRCGVNNSNLEQVRRYMNEADHNVFNSVLGNEEKHDDEILESSRDADDDDEYSKQINEALGMDDVEQFERVDENYSKEICSTDEIRSDVEEVTDEFMVMDESELSEEQEVDDVMDDVEQVNQVNEVNTEDISRIREINIDVEEVPDEISAMIESEPSEKVQEADEKYLTLNLDESLEKDTVEQARYNNGDTDEFKFMMDELPLPSDDSFLNEIRDSTLNFEDFSVFRQFIQDVYIM